MNVRLRQVIYSLGIVGVMLLSSNVYSQPQGDMSTGMKRCGKR